jgi:hypothetical protein
VGVAGFNASNALSLVVTCAKAGSGSRQRANIMRILRATLGLAPAPLNSFAVKGWKGSAGAISKRFFFAKKNQKTFC